MPSSVCVERSRVAPMPRLRSSDAALSLCTSRSTGLRKCPGRRENKPIVGGYPKLVGDIYRAAFGHEEPSREPTEMGTGRILALTSNRQQDYEGALYALAEGFP